MISMEFLGFEIAANLPQKMSTTQPIQRTGSNYNTINIETQPEVEESHASKEPTLSSSLRAVAFTNFYINLLLVFVPLGFISHFAHWGDTATFALNFMAIVPLAKMLDLGTDELSKRVGQAVGALINASFGNAVELIIGVIALRAGLLDVVKASLLGSILSNLLFVLGFCFFFGGIYNPISQKFNSQAANAAATLLAVTILGFLLPAAFALQTNASNTDPRVIAASHGTALLLFIGYIAFLVFQLVTHKSLYDQSAEEGEEEEEKELTGPVAMGVLIVSAIFIAFCAEYLVDSIEGISQASHLSERFIGMIILPIVGNAAEHVTAVFAAMRNKMDLAVGVALGSSMQIALFVTPFLVIVAWGLGTPLVLNFPVFDTSVLFVTILIVNQMIGDGETNWLEGFMLLLCYTIVAILYYYIDT